jgi:hypothetical protein
VAFCEYGVEVAYSTNMGNLATNLMLHAQKGGFTMQLVNFSSIPLNQLAN